jgi:hypothetical protein
MHQKEEGFMILQITEFSTEGWESIERTNKFLTGPAKDLTDSQKRFLTPVALDTEQINALKKLYHESTRKVGFIYSVPMFNLSTSVKYRGMTWMITTAGLIDDYNRHLLANFSISLPVRELEVVSSYAKDVIEKHVRFWKGDCSDAVFKLIKVRDPENNYYGFKIVDEYFPFREVK